MFSDIGEKHFGVARKMGFSRTKYPGLYVRNNPQIDPAVVLKAFPDALIEEVSHEEIGRRILDKMRMHMEAGLQNMLPGFGGMEDSGPAIAPQAGFQAPATNPQSTNPTTQSGAVMDITPLMIEALPLGMNRFGEEVLETPSGERFVRIVTDEKTTVLHEGIRRPISEASPETDEREARFLRGDTEGSLDLSCDGFVRSMMTGRNARVDDFARFFRAVTGREMPDVDPEIDRIAQAVDRARVRKLATLSQSADPDAYIGALRLHEAAQYYTVVKEGRMTPLPMAVIVQSIVASMPADARVRVATPGHGELSTFIDSVFQPATQDAPESIVMAAYEPDQMDQGIEVMGSMMSRTDHASVLRAIERMQAGIDATSGAVTPGALTPEVAPVQTLGVFVIGGDGIPGRIGPPSRHFLNALATHYTIEGIVDVDGAMMGAPDSPPSRIVVVGNRRESPGHANLPPSVPYVTDYQQLFSWGASISSAIRVPGSVPYRDRGGVSDDQTIEENSYQAPYIPTSMLSDPALMIPRNLASPTRRAMLNITRDTPLIDPWLQDKLGMDAGELKQSLSAEQADAVAVALNRLQSGLGFMEADQTGIGKGRVLAAIARASKQKGQPVIFITERAGLFQDFWRDIEDVGADKYFRNILIVNDDSVITSMKTGAEVARSADRDMLTQIMRDMKFPPGVDLVMATYSQFNRDPIKALKKTDIDLDATTRSQLSDKAKQLIEWAQRSRKSAGLKEAKEVVVEAHDILSDPTLIPKLPTEALKPMWIAKAASDALLVMDESHNASGETSQTNLNLEHAVMNAKEVVYSSATFARGEANMRIYRRLFERSVDVEGLHETLKKGGEPLQEATTSMLAEDGALIRREHDLSMIKFEPRTDVQRKARNETYADQLAEILAAITSLTRETRQYTEGLSDQMKQAIQAAHSAAGNSGNSSQSVGIIKRSPIGTSLYSVMRSFITLLKTDLAVEEAVQSIREGRKPVIVIEHTMESELNRSLSEAKEKDLAIDDGEGNTRIPAAGIRQILKKMLETSMKVELDGKDVDFGKEHNFAVAIRQIEALIDQFPDMPYSPLDIVREGIERAGFNVAELSGRKRRISYQDDGSMMIERIPASERKSAVDRFNNGDAHAILLTRAGNSGISLHSYGKFLNTDQRELIEVEVPEDVVARTQFFGRVNRNGQVCPPVIKTLSSGLPAEERILALQNNKLRRMSANITGNRDNAALTRDIADIINDVGNEVAFRFLEVRPELARKLDIDISDAAEKEDEEIDLRGEKYVAQVLSRSVMLKVAEQIEILDELTEEFNLLIADLDAKGENPLKPKLYDVNAKKIGTEVLELASAAANQSQNRIQSTFDKPVMMTTIEYVATYEPMPSSAVLAEIERNQAEAAKRIEKAYGSAAADLFTRDKEAFFSFLIDAVIERRNEAMEQALSQRHATVADAISDNSNNVTKQIHFRSERLIETLMHLRPGGRIKYFDNERGMLESNAVIVGISIPDPKGAHYPARYTVKIARPGSRKIETVPLSRLLSDKSFGIQERKASKRWLDAFDAVKSGSYKVQRNVLDGNLFRAAEMSLQAGIGTQAYYTDENGMAHRAVVLPLYASAAKFNHLPLRIHDPKLAAEFFHAVKSGQLFSLSGVARKDDNFKASSVKRGISVRRSGEEMVISVPGTQHWMNWLRNHPDLMKVTGPFGGTRDEMFATIPATDIDPLIEQIYRSGSTLYAHEDAHARVVNKADANNVSSAGHQSARQWFVARLGDGAIKASDTKDIVAIVDPMDDVDGKKGPKAA
jgi:hypothetical protein